MMKMESEFSFEEDYVTYATFMAGVSAYTLSAKEKYDPLRIFLSSKIDPLPYQIFDFSRLMEELKKQGNIRVLIAYETGLGKTILAGMVLQEVVATMGDKVPARILVLTPPGVLAQFHDELKEKFGINLNIFDSQEGIFSNQMITSIDTLKLDHWYEYLENQTWDLVLVDELHRVSPDNLRGKLMELISRRTNHLLTLTATPHDGISERYEYRLELISPSPLIIRRTKREALDVINRPLFDQDVIETTEEFDVTPAEIEFYEAAERYARERFKGSGTGALVAVVIGRATSSSIRAGVKMLAKRYAKLQVPGPEAPKEIIEAAREHLQEGGELSESEIDAILGADPISPEERDAELALIRPVLEMGRKLVSEQAIDSKGRYFLENLEKWIEEDRKCLVFTGFLETVEYLCEILEQAGYHPQEITSRVSLDERKRTVKRLTHDEGTRIIIGTDAMSESLNLQAASVEVNYEVPWSPVSYIQRVGRIWRLGQKHKSLYIHNFLPAFKVERRVLEVVLEKIKTINDEFGEVGLSVFSRELGSVEDMVRRDYEGEDVQQRVEDAYRESQRVSRHVLDVLNTSMTLPRVVNLEELQRSAHINFEETFTENDLYGFLEYLKHTGYASGHLPKSETGLSTYHVNSDGEYIPVVTPSLHDHGVKAAIKVAKSIVERTSEVQFAYHKSMRGQLVLYRVDVDGTTVYEEPILVTPDGVLTYDGIVSLLPHYIGSQSTVTFIPLSDYIEKRKHDWLDRRMALWESKKKDLELQILEIENISLKEARRASLKEHMAEKPKDVRVEQVKEICEVEFDKTESEQSWLERHEVEQQAMDAAMEYYRKQGYEVQDIARQNRGYDVLCRKRIDVLRVEVKGIHGASHPTLTEKERRTAVQFEDGFVLFILDIGEDYERKFAIPDPITNVVLTPNERTVYSVTGYTTFEIGSGMANLRS
jgi:superfamily II DNA or RNA helicase